jgi:hypothetical protein
MNLCNRDGWMAGLMALCCLGALPAALATDVVASPNTAQVADVDCVPLRLDVSGVTACDVSHLLAFARAYAATADGTPTLKATADAMAPVLRVI